MAPKPETPLDFELDVQVVQDGPVVPELMLNTDDGCGSTCQGACVSS